MRKTSGRSKENASALLDQTSRKRDIQRRLSHIDDSHRFILARVKSLARPSLVTSKSSHDDLSTTMSYIINIA